MKAIKYLLCLLLAVANVLHAEYKSPVNPDDYPREEIVKGTNALKAMPLYARECLIAETMGLLVSPNKGSAYSLKLNRNNGEIYHDVVKDAQYFNSQGKECKFWSTCGEMFSKKNLGKTNSQAWGETKRAMAVTCRDAILAAFEKDVTKLVCATAKYRLKCLSPKLRDAWLALYGGMCYKPDGSEAHYEESSWQRHGTVDIKQQVVWRTPDEDVLFTDSKGNEYKLKELMDKNLRSQNILKQFNVITWCSNLVGVEDILNLFPQEVKAMRKYHKQAGMRLKEAAQEEPQETPPEA